MHWSLFCKPLKASRKLFWQLWMLEGLVAGAGSKEKTIWWQPWGYQLSQATLIHGKFHIIWYQLKKPSYFRTLSYNIDIHWFISGKSYTSHDEKPQSPGSSSIAMRNLCACPSNAKELLHDSVKAAAAAAVPAAELSWPCHGIINPQPNQKNCCNSDQVIFDVVCLFFCLHHFFLGYLNHRFRAMGDEMIFCF